MKKTISTILVIVACLCFAHGDAYQQLTVYQFGGDRAFITALEKEAFAATPKQRLVIEEKLLGVLTAPDANAGGKHYACRILARIATKQSVPVLAKMLSDKQSGHMAMFALSTIDDSSVDTALRNALNSTTGDNRVAVINQLGRRGDSKAVPVLIKLAANQDSATAEAALTALGKIGNKKTFQALEKFNAPPSRCVARDNALLRCAENMKPSQALKVYKRLAADRASPAIRIAALRGQVISDPGRATAIIIDLLNQKDRRLRNLGSSLAIEIKDSDLTTALTTALPSLEPDGQAAVLHVLEARGDRSAAASVATLTKSSDTAVRTTALNVLGTIGTADSVPPLVAAIASDPEIAKEALIRISAPGVNEAIILNLHTGGKDTKIALCRSVADRNMKQAFPALLELALADDPHITKAALESMGSIADQKDIPAMVDLLPELDSPALQAVAGKSVATAIVRQTDREQAVKSLRDAYPHADTQSKAALLNAMGQVGGAAILKTVTMELNSGNEKIKDAAVRAVANWPDDAALDLQYDIARTAESQTHRVLALRGYVQSIGVSELKNSEKMKLYQQAMAVTARPEDKKSVLAGLGSQRSNAALEVAATYLKDAQLKNEAASAVFRIYRSLTASQREKVKSVLQNIIDTSDNEKLVAGAKKALASKPKKKKK